MVPRVVSGLENLVFGSMDVQASCSLLLFFAQLQLPPLGMSGGAAMSRPVRVEFPGATYHVLSHGVDGAPTCVHLNPVKAHLCARPDDYAWSSYRRYLGSDPGLDWIDVSKTLDCFASPTDYAAFVLQGLQQDLADPFDGAIGGLFFGSDAFAAQLRPLVRTPHLIEDIPQTRALNAVAAPSLEAIRSAVMDTFSVLSDCQRQRMFVYALRRFSHATGREIASVTGRSPSAVTHVWRELQDRLTVDMTFKQQVEALARILRAETPKLS